MTGVPWHGSLVGLPWPLAQAILQQRAVPYRTEATRPPGRAVNDGELRVVQERQGPEGLVVVLAHFSPRSGQEAQ